MSAPTVSVCAPYWMRQDALDHMQRMYRSRYLGLRNREDFEVVIADDGSPEPARVTDPRFRVVRLPEKTRPLNPCVPINRAVEASHGEIVVLTNPEMVHDGFVLDELVDMLETEDDYVAARCYGVGYGPDWLWLAGPDTDYTTRGRLPVPPGAHFHFLAAMHRSLWDRAGGFDEDYRGLLGCDDNDFLWRLHRAGARFKCAEGSVWQRKSETEWNLPHGRELFFSKWPEAREAVEATA